MTTREARKSKGLRGKWSSTSMQKAIEMVETKRMGLLEASKEF